MNIVLYGRPSYEASIHVPLPVDHHRRVAPPRFGATALYAIPDNHAAVVRRGCAAPPAVTADNRTDGRAHPSDRDVCLYAARSEHRTGQAQPLFEEFVHSIRDGALSTSTVPRIRPADRVRAWKPLLSPGPLRRDKRHNPFPLLRRSHRLWGLQTKLSQRGVGRPRTGDIGQTSRPVGPRR